MPVTDDQYETLRALLVGDLERQKQLREQLKERREGAGYFALIEAACFLAVDRAFNTATDDSEIIAYVAEVRSRTEDAAQRLDPVAAERLIKAVLGRADLDDLDDGIRTRTELIVLGALVADKGASNHEVERLLNDARKLADSWLN